MALVTTNFRNTRESARQLRVEPGPFIATNVQDALEEISGALAGTPVAAGQSPYNVVLDDAILYVDTSGGAVTINLMPTAVRFGRPLTIKDVTGHAAANPISVVPAGSEKIDTLAPYPINSDFGGIRINPIASGYTVAP